MTNPALTALRILAVASERANDRPLPIRTQNKRRRVLGEAIKLAKATIRAVQETIESEDSARAEDLQRGDVGGLKIINGLHEAIAGKLQRVTISGQVWERRDPPSAP